MIILIGGEAGGGGVRAGTRCGIGLHLSLVAITGLTGMGPGPKLLEKKS